MEEGNEIVKTETQAESEPKRMTKKEFWIRFAVWFAVAVAAPFSYVCFRFGLFTQTEATSKISGWGIIAFTFLGFMLIKIVRSARKGLCYGSMAAQCIDGYTLLIPLICFILVLELIKRNIESFEEFLIVTALCEAVAIPINPMRRWAYEHNTEAFTEIVAKGIKKGLGNIFNKKGKE